MQNFTHLPLDLFFINLSNSSTRETSMSELPAINIRGVVAKCERAEEGQGSAKVDNALKAYRISIWPVFSPSGFFCSAATRSLSIASPILSTSYRFCTAISLTQSPCLVWVNVVFSLESNIGIVFALQVLQSSHRVDSALLKPSRKPYIPLWITQPAMHSCKSESWNSTQSSFYTMPLPSFETGNCSYFNSLSELRQYSSLNP